MKRDQYIPHDVSMRSNSQVINLIEAEGAAGYGFYWAVMEYLRTQDDYVGDLRAVRALARQMKIQLPKALRILQKYSLFVVDEFTFHSPKLNERMQPMMQKLSESTSKVEQKSSESASKSDCNSLKTNPTSGTIKKRREKKRIVTSSSKEEDDAADADDVALSSVPAWERYVDSLDGEEQWKELIAMRSGLGKTFLRRFGDILRFFKMHIRAMGKERDLLSPSDAKRYFCFYITPGSATHTRLLEQLRTPPPHASPHEQTDPDTGQRSYCGIPIPKGAPPRPNAQAVWDDAARQWRY